MSINSKTDCKIKRNLISHLKKNHRIYIIANKTNKSSEFKWFATNKTNVN